MKQLLLVLLLSVQAVLAQVEPEKEAVITQDDWDKEIEIFRAGNAADGEAFYAGLLSGIIDVDVFYRQMEEADNADRSEKEILKLLDDCEDAIQKLRDCLQKYDTQEWPLKAEFIELSLDWVKGVEGMIENYARPLALPMSKPDEEWTDEEYVLYEKWQSAYNEFLHIDAQWVAFQFEYANANDFKLSDETIDIDSLLSKYYSRDEIYEQFYDGKTLSAKVFFQAIRYASNDIRIHYAEMVKLDLSDALVRDLALEIDQCKDKIDFIRLSLTNTAELSWQNQEEFMQLTQKWIDHIDNMLNNYAKPLIGAMSRAQSTLTSKEKKAYKQWETSYSDFEKIDARWIDVQTRYAEANDFEINVDEFLEESEKR